MLGSKKFPSFFQVEETEDSTYKIAVPFGPFIACFKFQLRNVLLRPN